MELRRIKDLLNDFHNISGMEISLLNSSFHTLVSCRASAANVCSLIHRCAGAVEMCKSSDIEHLVEVSENHSGMMYTCPYGLTEVIVPIVRNDKILAYLIASMGICSDDSDFEKKLPRSMYSKFDTKEIERAFSNTVRSDREKAESYFNIIKVLADHIANDVIFAEKDESIGALVKLYVKNNLDKKITLREIARNLHCSTVTVTEHFKSEFGITVNEYVTEKRMEMAKKLLLSTDEPLRTVASMLGYPDVEYFSRSFKRRFGTPPATWRKQERY